MSGRSESSNLSYLLDTPKIVYWASNLGGQKFALKRTVLERNGVLSGILSRQPLFHFIRVMTKMA
jgi:hypothetical protein